MTRATNGNRPLRGQIRQQAARDGGKSICEATKMYHFHDSDVNHIVSPRGW